LSAGRDAIGPAVTPTVRRVARGRPPSLHDMTERMTEDASSDERDQERDHGTK